MTPRPQPSPLPTASWQVRFLSYWVGEAGTSAGRNAAFAACLSLICFATVFIDTPWFYKYTQDVFVLLDGGWRVLHGQRPHADFFTGIGPVSYLLAALGMILAGMRPGALGVGAALFGMVVGLWAYGVALRRLPSRVAAVLAAVFLTLLAVAPYALGERPIDTGIAVTYNRYGAALLGIVLIETYRPIGSCVAGFGGGLSTGLLCGLMLFTKFTFLAGAVPFIILAIFYGHPTRRRYLVGLSVGFVLAIVPMLWYLNFDLTAMGRDFLQIALSRRGQPSRVWAIVSSYFDWMGLAVLVVLWSAVHSSRSATPSHRGWLQQREAVYALVTTMVGALILFTGNQANGMPLNALMAILISGNISLSGAVSRLDRESVLLRTSLVVAALLVALPSMASDSIGVGFSIFRQARYGNLDPRFTFQSPRMRGIVAKGVYPRSTTVDYIRDIEDGIRLIERNSGQADCVYSLDFTNPFAYAMARQPCRGGSWSLHYNMVISKRYHPEPDFLVGNAQILMEPKYPVADLAGILGIYGDYVKGHFHLVAESPSWRMYRRNG